MSKNITFANNLDKGFKAYNETAKEHELKFVSSSGNIQIFKHPTTIIREDDDENEFIYNIVSSFICGPKYFTLHKKLKIKLDVRGAYIKIFSKKCYINSLYDQYIINKTWTNEKECVSWTKCLSYNTGSPKYYIFKSPQNYYFIRKKYCNGNMLSIYEDAGCELRGWVEGYFAFQNN